VKARKKTKSETYLRGFPGGKERPICPQRRNEKTRGERNHSNAGGAREKVRGDSTKRELGPGRLMLRKKQRKRRRG